MMRDALGAHAAAVTFVDVSSAYTRPARTLAAYHKVYAEQLQKTPKLRAVADVQFGPDPREWNLWTGYEAVFNRSFGHLPAWVWCTYNANGTPDPIIEGVWQTHREVVARNVWTRSGLYEDPDYLLRRITPPPEDLILSGRSQRDVTPSNSASASRPSSSPPGWARRRRSTRCSPPPRSRPMPSSMGRASRTSASAGPMAEPFARSPTEVLASTTPPPATSPPATESEAAFGSPGSSPGNSSSSGHPEDSPRESGSRRASHRHPCV